jgi:FAD/FMN-containing dehydrogenase
VRNTAFFIAGVLLLLVQSNLFRVLGLLLRGVGWMVRKLGLTLDHVVAVELVTAEGNLVRASEAEYPDLFWAVRGGGGNFGVATYLEIEAFPIGQVYGGMVLYDMQDLKKVFTGWRDYMRIAPEELTTMLLVMPPNPAFADMPTGVMVLVCYAGDDETAAVPAGEAVGRAEGSDEVGGEAGVDASGWVEGSIDARAAGRADAEDDAAAVPVASQESDGPRRRR